MGGLVYHAPWWLPGAQLQTLWPAWWGRNNLATGVTYHRERWTTPDDDFVDVDYLVENPTARATESGAKHASGLPLLVLFHGLEGSSHSHYALAFAHYAQSQGWAYAVPHLRGCSGSINRAPRAYHSGDHLEVDWILRRMCQNHPGPVYAVGVSLGGNALLRWAQEHRHGAPTSLRAIAAVCAPLDLAACADALDHGINRQVYTPLFLRTMKPRALAKWDQYPGLFDRDALRQVRSLRAFDGLVTAPLHGFQGASDYYARASAKPGLACIRLPTLLVNALNDPFVPVSCLPNPEEVGQQVTLWQPTYGGHVGFASGAPPGNLQALPTAVGWWLQTHAS